MARSANDNEDKGRGQDKAVAPEDEPTGRPCAICGKPALVRYKPFCSRRCSDVDLGRWLSGVYAVPSAPDETEADEDVPDEPRER